MLFIIKVFNNLNLVWRDKLFDYSLETREQSRITWNNFIWVKCKKHSKFQEPEQNRFFRPSHHLLKMHLLKNSPHQSLLIQFPIFIIDNYLRFQDIVRGVMVGMEVKQKALTLFYFMDSDNIFTFRLSWLWRWLRG